MPSNDIPEAARRYAARGHRRVDGWLTREAVRLVCAVARSQAERGIGGTAAEIGIHHGKLFILLALLVAPDGEGYACDLFDRQADNVDRSGRGDRERFECNLARQGCDPARIRIHAGSSRELTPESLAREIGQPVRLFSVDGGHTAGVTRHDFTLATSVLAPGGVLIADDLFNEDWPGVVDGVMRFVLDRPEALFPFAIGGNKVLFTNSRSHADAYRESLLAAFRPWELKASEFLGVPVLILSRRDRLVRRLKRTAIGRLLRDNPLVERVRGWQRRFTGS